MVPGSWYRRTTSCTRGLRCWTASQMYWSRSCDVGQGGRDGGGFARAVPAPHGVRSRARRILAAIGVGVSIRRRWIIGVRGCVMGLVTHQAVEFLGTDPVPVEPYYKPEYFELERERIFRHAWLFLGREEE